MNIMARKREGNEVLVLVSDCGPHQHNQWMVDLMQFLRDHGFFLFVVGIFLEQEHSKYDADKAFGTATQVWAYRTQITLEDLGFQLLGSPRHESCDRRYRMHYVSGDSCSDWKPMFRGMYRPITHMSRNGAGRNEHVIVVGDPADLMRLSSTKVTILDSAGNEEVTDLRTEMKRLISTRPHHVRCWTLPPPASYGQGRTYVGESQEEIALQTTIQQLQGELVDLRDQAVVSRGCA